MKLNVGNLESIIRIFAGVILTYAALYGYVGQWGLVGIYVLATGLGRVCPITTVLGINTYHEEGVAHH